VAQAYVPGLRVTESTTIRRERILPLKGTVIVEEGQAVQAEDVVARTALPGPVKTLNVVNLLGIDQSQINDFMLKKAGDSFEKGEVIAQNKPFLGISFLQSKIIAEFDGTVDTVSEITGQVILRHPPRLVEIHAYFDGRIVEVRPEEGVVVECSGSFIQGIFGIGGETNGILEIAVAGPNDVLDADQIKPEHHNKILVGGRLFTSRAFEKAKSLGVRGVIAGGFHDKDLKGILGYDLGVAITGHEDLGLTLVMTEGFGEITMAHKTFELLKKRAGSKTSISGATQIRAGVIRPEVIIPGGEAPAGAAAAESDHSVEGAMIRCIRDPYFGQLGRVTQMIPELQVVQSETKVRVLEVEFDDGTRAIIPRANIEMIED
jgi:hypothetical protein